jgi:hypothetical protein
LAWQPPFRLLEYVRVTSHTRYYADPVIQVVTG